VSTIAIDMETDKAIFGTVTSENFLGRLMVQVTLPETHTTNEENAWDSSIEEKICALELLLQDNSELSLCESSLDRFLR